MAVFYRLYGDIITQLNKAVDHRISEGATQSSIAEDAGQDPAFLSRIVSGQSGTNLRSIAAVLYATRYRLRIQAVSCDQLTQEAEHHRQMGAERELVRLISHDGVVWRTPHRLEDDRSGEQLSRSRNAEYVTW